MPPTTLQHLGLTPDDVRRIVATRRDLVPSVRPAAPHDSKAHFQQCLAAGQVQVNGHSTRWIDQEAHAIHIALRASESKEAYRARVRGQRIRRRTPRRPRSTPPPTH